MPPATTERGYASDTGGAFWNYDHEDAPELRWPLSVWVYDAMRRQDAQTASVLRAVTLPVRRTAWRIEAAGARPEVARFVAEDLGLPLVGEQLPPAPRSRDRFSWSEHLQHALLMLVYGHMFFEQVYRLDEQGRARLRKIAPRLPRTLAAVNVAADGGLVSIDQWSAAGSNTDRADPGGPAGRGRA